MVNRKKLEEMSKESAAGTAIDLLDMVTAGETPAQRLERYLAQAGNPYHVRVGKTQIRLLFHDEERALPEKLKSYFLSLKNSDFSGKMRYDKGDYREGDESTPLNHGKD